MQISELLRTLLQKRGFTDDGRIEQFLEPDYDRDTHSPLLLNGMEHAVDRFFAALDKNERIAVYADFDCDGIPGGALFSDFFKKICYENFLVYLPHRDREGHGFHKSAIDTLKADGVSLIITVDVGTTATEAAAYAKANGVDVIITDHHEILGDLPETVAVVNPKISGYPFPDLCGAAVAFKLVQALLMEGKKRGRAEFVAVPDGWEKWLLDLVAIATVADLVPLVGENRVLAHFGLKVLRRSPRRGLLALINRLRLRRADITEDDISFSIAPRINAASRMDEPQLALALLTTMDSEEGERLAAHLEELNAKRKAVVASIVRSARKNVEARFQESDRVLVVGNPEWKPSLLGLVANSLVEDRGGMVCVWGRDAEGRLKGSCRSDGSVSVVEIFQKASGALVEFGGHKQSGGFTVSQESIHTLHDVFAAAASDIPANPSAAASAEDAILSLSELSPALFADVSRLAPFGIGNPKPRFLFSQCIVTSVRRFGKEKNHVELALECRHTGSSARAFDFFRAPEDFTMVPAQGTLTRVSASIERDTYRGGLALRVVDVLTP